MHRLHIQGYEFFCHQAVFMQGNYRYSLSACQWLCAQGNLSSDTLCTWGEYPWLLVHRREHVTRLPKAVVAPRSTKYLGLKQSSPPISITLVQYLLYAKRNLIPVLLHKRRKDTEASLFLFKLALKYILLHLLQPPIRFFPFLQSSLDLVNLTFRPREGSKSSPISIIQ